MNGRSINVLIIEDHEGDAGLIKEIFSECTQAVYNLAFSRSLADGLEHLKKGTTDIVLLDLSLPDSTGMEALLKTHAISPDVPIVVLTGLDDKAVAFKAVREGAQDYLLKGRIDGSGLEKAVLYAIERQRLSSEMERVSREIQSLEDKLQIMFESVSVGITFSDLDGTIVDINQSAVSLIGAVNKNELIGKSAFDLFVPEDRHEAMENLKKTLEKGSSGVLEYTLLGRGGRKLQVEMNATLLRDRTNYPVGFVAITKDISERKEAEERQRKSMQRLEKAMEGFVQTIAAMVEQRDPYTAGHQRRVSRLAVAMAAGMGIPEETVNAVYMAGMIHDIGKISVPAEILAKPTRLTDIEFDMIKTHPQVGYDILKNVEFPWPIADIVLQHHERLNGSGYPKGLKGDEILLESRIIAVADVVEAMSTHRPYRPALGIDVALDEIRKNRGTLFDPHMVDACFELFEKGEFTFDD